MARRQVQYVLVCEDQQQEAFVRRFLKETGLLKNRRKLRIERASAGIGSAEQFVRAQYVKELTVGRRHPVERTLIIVIDGDKYGVKGRLRQLDKACDEKGIDVRMSTDRVAKFIPTWNIETWLAYLAGDTVNEHRKDYLRLPRPSDCTKHAKELAAMCKERRLREPAPESLKAACSDYHKSLR